MARVCLNLITLAIFLLPSLSFAQNKSGDIFRIKLHQGKYLTSVGQWDLAEAKYLDVSKSPWVEDRIKAYRGLTKLYKILHLNQKEKQAQAQLEIEEKFSRSLVPKWDSYYKNYEIKQGDTYLKLALREKISMEWLMRVNHVKPLIEGDTIRLPKIHYSLVVDKEEKTITWKRGSEIIKVYQVAIGREGMETPAGEFAVINKVENPIWYNMNKEYPADSPQNLLGTRWMGLDVKSYGIHGTRNPESIGNASSHGCIRMHNRDVEELFQWIPVGTKVVIS